MNDLNLQQKLIRLARATPINDHIPVAFEKRILALIPVRRPDDVWAFWSHALWRAAAPCVGLMLVMGAWTAFSSENRLASNNYSTDLESALLAPLHSPETVW